MKTLKIITTSILVCFALQLSAQTKLPSKNSKAINKKTNKVKQPIGVNSQLVKNRVNIPVIGSNINKIKKKGIPAKIIGGVVTLDKKLIDDKTINNKSTELTASNPINNNILIISKAINQPKVGVVMNQNGQEIVLDFTRPSRKTYIVKVEYNERLGSHGNTNVSISNRSNYSNNVTTIQLDETGEFYFLTTDTDDTYIKLNEGNVIINKITCTETNINLN